MVVLGLTADLLPYPIAHRVCIVAIMVLITGVFARVLLVHLSLEIVFIPEVLIIVEILVPNRVLFAQIMNIVVIMVITTCVCVL